MKFAFVLAGTCFAAAICAAGPVVTTNLLTNAGAENGDLTGWTGTASLDNGSFDGIDPYSGSYDFFGGRDTPFPIHTLSQTVSLVSNQGITAADIDTGSLVATVSFWEQGANEGNPSDDAEIAVEFHDATHLLSAGSTPVLDSHGGSWGFQSTTFSIPPGTRSIRYTMEFLRNAGTNSDAFVDDASLTIASPAVSVTPEPSALGLLVAAIFAAGALRAARKRAIGSSRLRSRQHRQ
jgi:hypothetical protein